MVITNWLAVGEGNYGLVFPDQFLSIQARIYGNIHGHLNFEDGEYIRTAVVKGYIHTSEARITTIAGEVFELKNKEQNVYVKYLKARWNKNLTILKYWRVVNGLLVGKTLDGKEIAGRVVGQNISENLCRLDDGRLIFVDWLSKADDYVPERRNSEFLVFGIDRCMPDIFGSHFYMFKKCN